MGGGRDDMRMEVGNSPVDSLTCRLTLKYAGETRTQRAPCGFLKGLQATRTDAYGEGLWLKLQNPNWSPPSRNYLCNRLLRYYMSVLLHEGRNLV